ncbi:hypothetical protein [Streptomyces sp. NBC_01408]|uniref:hypothetical protein n=1 Tax=Streptomyces sp. NBC_01408 TaxID=2903855 RepID=UPI002255B365|nr:hypothetical protein [Streptomyces sp. NBC_01408]MCX4691289.1 hypothetical protein [Streptomyces sp. NBC_01408]
MGTTAACAGQEEPTEKVAMNEQQAVSRAKEIVQQAVASLSPQPTLQPVGRQGPGACLADYGVSTRAQVGVSYQLTNVPGSAAKDLLGQVRDAWVAQGYKFKTKEGEGDWAKPDPYISMRTEPDNFWMSGGVGITNAATGEGIAHITIHSPCYPKPEQSASPSPQALSQSQSGDEASQQAVLAHSSRIYDALRVRHDAAGGGNLRTVENEGSTYVHHAWATEPLAEDRAARAMARAQGYFEGSGWRVRSVAGRIIALNPADEVAAQLARADDGGLNVGVTGPATPVLHTAPSA